MQKILADYLTKYKGDLKDRYQWKFNLETPKEEFGIKFEGMDNWYKRTQMLKKSLIQKLNQNQDKKQKIKIADYFIREWGGISAFRGAESVVDMFESLNKGNTQNIPDFNFQFDRISSWSKYLSLLFPEWARIYDARVAYSLNVINYINGANEKIFPIPSGRNSKLNLIDIETLLLIKRMENGEKINLENLEDRLFANEIRQRHYIKDNDVYREYLILIKGAAKSFNDDSWDSNTIEMLLFALADNEVFKDLVNYIQKSKTTA